MKPDAAPDNTLLNAWSRLRTTVEARPHRERWVLLALLVVLTLMVTHHYGVDRVHRAIDVARADIATLESEYQEWIGLRQELEARIGLDLQDDLQRRGLLLRADRDRLQEAVREHLERFIEPDRVSSMLRALMQATEGLQFRYLISLPPEALGFQDGQPETAFTPVYRRGVEVHFLGTYQGLIRWIDQIEAEPWIVQWDRLRIETTDASGLSHFSIRIYTLTLDEDWIRV